MMNKRTDDFYMADSFERDALCGSVEATAAINNLALSKGINAVDALECIKANNTISWEPMSALAVAKGELSVSETNSYVTKDALQKVTDKVTEMANSLAELKKSLEAPYSKPLRAKLCTLDTERYKEL